MGFQKVTRFYATYWITFHELVSNGIAINLVDVFKNSFCHVGFGAVFHVLDRLDDFRCFNVCNRTIAKNGNDVGVNATFYSVDITLALAMTPLLMPVGSDIGK